MACSDKAACAPARASVIPDVNSVFFTHQVDNKLNRAEFVSGSGYIHIVRNHIAGGIAVIEIGYFRIADKTADAVCVAIMFG